MSESSKKKSLTFILFRSSCGTQASDLCSVSYGWNRQKHPVANAKHTQLLFRWLCRKSRLLYSNRPLAPLQHWENYDASLAQHPLDRCLDVNLRCVENRQARSCRFTQN
jgi:hypothetical protein